MIYCKLDTTHMRFPLESPLRTGCQDGCVSNELIWLVAISRYDGVMWGAESAREFCGSVDLKVSMWVIVDTRLNRNLAVYPASRRIDCCWPPRHRWCHIFLLFVRWCFRCVSNVLQEKQCTSNITIITNNGSKSSIRKSSEL